MNILLALILISNLAVLFFLLIFAIKISKVFLEFKSFITPTEENKPSPLALFVQSIADMFGRSIVATIKSTFMGKQSGESRAVAAVEGDIAEGMAQANPLASGILSSFPALKKTLRRNPQLLDFALQKLAGIGASKASVGSSSGAGNNGHTMQSQFKL